MDDSKEEVFPAAEKSLDAADDHSTVGISDLLGNHSDCKSSFIAQTPGEEVGPVFQILRCG